VGLAGCGKTGSLSGKVTFQNAPVPKGTRIIFLHVQSDRSVQTEIQSDDGSYTCDKVPVGECKIGVLPFSSPNLAGQIGMAAGGKDKKGGVGPPSGKDEMQPPINPYGGVFAKDSEARKAGVNIPEKYRDPRTSDLTVTVTGGKQELSFMVPDN